MVGFLNVFKPSGITSNAVLTKIKKKFNISKVGHMGTLDPLASGILPIGVSKATKLFNLFQNKTKCYKAQITFGYETTTLDSEGEIVKTDNMNISLNSFLLCLQNFPKEYAQMPPKFSAKSVNGVRAYKLARDNVDFELKPKNVRIYSFNNITKISDNVFEFDVECSSGTYIRSLIKDIAQSLNTVATMTKLIRTKVEMFAIENSITLEDLLNANSINDVIIPVTDIFNFKTLNFDSSFTKYLDNGCLIKQNNSVEDHVPYFIKCNNVLYGLYNNENGYIKLITFLKENYD